MSPAWPPKDTQPTSGADRRIEQRETLAGDRLVELHYIQNRSAITDLLDRRSGRRLCRDPGGRHVGRFVWRVLPWMVADSLIATAGFLAAYFLRFLDTHARMAR